MSMGKTVLHFSKDNGITWSDSKIINNSPIDDRDAGIISLGGKKLLVSWFTSDTRIYSDSEWLKETMTKEDHEAFIKEISSWDDEMVYSHLGSWIKISEDGTNWGEPIRVPVTAPHGPIKLANGDLLYLGKGINTGEKFHYYQQEGAIKSTISKDEGRNWEIVGEVPIPADTEAANYHEPHAVELSSGKIIGMIRYQHSQKIKNMIVLPCSRQNLMIEVRHGLSQNQQGFWVRRLICKDIPQEQLFASMDIEKNLMVKEP